MDTNLLTTEPEEAVAPGPETTKPIDETPTETTEAIPEKFRNADTGEVRVDMLLKSYQELERKLGTMVRLPGESATEEEIHQLFAWGKAHLPEAVLGALSTTAEGIFVMHRMMAEGEPAILQSNGAGATTNDESQLREMIKDPRYWRDRDPDFVNRVSEGFQKLYPESAEA